MYSITSRAFVKGLRAFGSSVQKYPAQGLYEGIGHTLKEEEIEALRATMLERRIALRTTAPYAELLQLYIAYPQLMDRLYAASCPDVEDVNSYILDKLAQGICPVRRSTWRVFRQQVTKAKSKNAIYMMDVSFLSELLGYVTDKACIKVEGKKVDTKYLPGPEDLDELYKQFKKALGAYIKVLKRFRAKEGTRTDSMYVDLSMAGALLYENQERISVPVMPYEERTKFLEGISAYNRAKAKYAALVKRLQDMPEALPAYTEFMRKAAALKEEIKKAEGLKKRYLKAQQPWVKREIAKGNNVTLNKSTYYVRMSRAVCSLDKVVGGPDTEDKDVSVGDTIARDYSCDYRKVLCEKAEELTNSDFFCLMAYLSGANQAVHAAKKVYMTFTGIKVSNKREDLDQVEYTNFTLADGAKLSARDIADGILGRGREVMFEIYEELKDRISVRNARKTVADDDLRKIFRSDLNIPVQINWEEYAQRLKKDADEYKKLVKLTKCIRKFREEHSDEDREELRYLLSKGPAELSPELSEYRKYRKALKRVKALKETNNDRAENYVNFIALQLKKKLQY